MENKKSKIGLMTFHFVNNFGGALQAYAVRRTVEKNFNAEVNTIDYQNWFIRFTDFVRLFPVTTNPKEILSGIKTMNKRFGRAKKFKAFSKKYHNLTERYNTSKEVERKITGFDKYICGSDQIWNPFITMGVAPCYFLDFEKDQNKKISYAPSFGSHKIKEQYWKEVSELIKDFKFLSVREEAGAEFIKELTGKDALRVIDPTFLLTKEEWSEVAVSPERKDPYILLYIMQRDESVYEYARNLKEKTGCKIIEVSRYGYKPDFIDESVIDIGPAEFLGLIKDATYVCTNSFHGFTFSLIFEKEFCLVPCKKFTARTEDLTKLLNLSFAENGNSPVKTYNKDQVQEKIKIECQNAIKYLADSIEA